MKRAERVALSVAPMMDYTDRHFRYFMRLLTKKTLLYTEMIPVQAVVMGKRYSLLDFSEIEKPLVLQLGGNDVNMMVKVAKIAQSMGYDEININVGCPSPIVQEGRFGVVLMNEPDTVAEIVSRLREEIDLPVGVKFRLGIDNFQRDFFLNFVEKIREAGCDRFIVHARIAILRGFDPKKNRTIPPLLHGEVYRLKQLYPSEIIETNGGIKSLRDASKHLNYIDGVMIGRAAYETPYIFVDADYFLDMYGEFLSNGGAERSEEFRFSPSGSLSPSQFAEIVEQMARYVEQMEGRYSPSLLLKPILNLYKGKPGAKLWRQHLSAPEKLRTIPPSRLLREALAIVLPRFQSSPLVV